MAARMPAARKEQVAAAVAPGYRKWLAARHRIALTAHHVEAFLNSPGKFDSELGYLPVDSVFRDGIDGSSSVYRYETTRERKRINYRDRPSRINTYGNSFTHGAQVSDGETWQEYLAAHFGEPIRNFGVSGYGVYQAFARLRRVEQTEVDAPYLIFNIFDDDHQRSIMPCAASS